MRLDGAEILIAPMLYLHRTGTIMVPVWSTEPGVIPGLAVKESEVAVQKYTALENLSDCMCLLEFSISKMNYCCYVLGQ